MPPPGKKDRSVRTLTRIQSQAATGVHRRRRRDARTVRRGRKQAGEERRGRRRRDADEWAITVSQRE